jgi:hypothetical protein
MNLLTLLNIVFFILSVVLFWRGASLRKLNAGEDLKSLHERIISRIIEVKRLNISGVQKVQNATEEAISHFSNLERRIRKTTEETREILDDMRKKAFLSGVRESMIQGTVIPPDAMRDRYAAIFKAVLEQMSLITDRKTEEGARLKAIRDLVESGTLGAADDTRPALNAALGLIHGVIMDIDEVRTAETRLIGSTLSILEDMVLALADAFIRVSAMVDQTLGESSSLGNEIGAIVVNLQCEDICQEMGEMTLSHLASILKDFKSAHVAIPDELNNEPARDTEEDDVTFF